MAAIPLEAAMAAAAARVEAALDARLSPARSPDVPRRLLAAMRHAMLGGGKRLRPFLVLESARLFEADHSAMGAALAVECLISRNLSVVQPPGNDARLERRTWLKGRGDRRAEARRPSRQPHRTDGATEIKPLDGPGRGR